MKIKKINKLLVEASKKETSNIRLNEIQCILNKEVIKSNNFEDRNAGILLIMDELYVSTIKNNPKLLPTLLPVFALICGDRKSNSIVADIDWSFINKKEKTFKLIEVDQTPCGNGNPEIYHTKAVSNDPEKLKTYCKETFGKEVGKPEVFSWDNYYIIEKTNNLTIL